LIHRRFFLKKRKLNAGIDRQFFLYTDEQILIAISETVLAVVLKN